MSAPSSSCPSGTSSAGYANACEGCPNQNKCQTGSKPPIDPAISEICENLASVDHVLLVMSGKGGVGKSTVSNMLSRALALKQETSVGLVDVDICGPSIPRMLGVENELIHTSSNGLSPIFVQENLAVMSIGFLLDNEHTSVVWRGDKKTTLIKQFLKDVDWQKINYLVIDTPLVHRTSI